MSLVSFMPPKKVMLRALYFFLSLPPGLQSLVTRLHTVSSLCYFDCTVWVGSPNYSRVMAYITRQRSSASCGIAQACLVQLLVSILLVLGPVNSSTSDISTDAPYAVGCFSAGSNCVSVPITEAQTVESLTNSVFTTLLTS